MMPSITSIRFCYIWSIQVVAIFFYKRYLGVSLTDRMPAEGTRRIAIHMDWALLPPRAKLEAGRRTFGRWK